MSRPIIKIVNLETGEEIEREMTDAELAQREADKSEAAAKEVEIAAKAANRQAILDRLGLSEEEVKLLLG